MQCRKLLLAALLALPFATALAADPINTDSLLSSAKSAAPARSPAC